MQIRTEEQREDALKQVRSIEQELYALHNNCASQGLIPKCFVEEWAHGVHLLQMCLAAKRTIITEYDIPNGVNPFYRD